MSKDDGGPAFPRAGFYHEDGPAEKDCNALDGMTLRDYIAARALEGLIQGDANIVCDECESEGTTLTRSAAKLSYKFADAMLRARKPNGT